MEIIGKTAEKIADAVAETTWKIFEVLLFTALTTIREMEVKMDEIKQS